MAEATLATIQVPPKTGRPKSRPQQLIAGKGFDSRKSLRLLHALGIRPCIPPKRRPNNWKPRQERPIKRHAAEYRHHLPVERTLAWLGHQPRLLVRHEHKATNVHAFYTLACIRIALLALLGVKSMRLELCTLPR